MPPLAALAAGLTGSLHCAAMCGPLACAGGSSGVRGAVSWQAGRLISYALLGAALGGSGSVALRAWAAEAAPVLPWVMAAGLVFTALDLGRHLKPLPGMGWVSGRIAGLGANFSFLDRGAAIGAATPFLPCGLVYGMALAALASGGAAQGGVLLGAFALGAVPALTAVQLHTRLWPKEGRWVAVARRAVPAVAAAVLVWRALAAPAAASGADLACH